MSNHWTNTEWWKDQELDRHLTTLRKRLKRERNGQQPLINDLEGKRMTKYPMNKAEAIQYRYDVYAYNPDGMPYATAQCAFGLIDRYHHEHQCCLKNGHGPDG